LVPGE
jgi:hypothetical protein